jgi:hypothetical protein
MLTFRPTQIFRNGKIPSESDCERDTLKTMRKLAYNSGRVPSRYHIDRRFLSVEEEVVASGAFAEVRKGMLDGTPVAIKTLRVADRKSQKVRLAYR